MAGKSQHRQFTVLAGIVALQIALISCGKSGSRKEPAEGAGKKTEIETVVEADTVPENEFRPATARDTAAWLAIWESSEAALTAALSLCTPGSEQSDSIAIALYEAMDSLGNELFDHQASAVVADSVLKIHGFAVHAYDGSALLKADPAFIAERFGSKLTEAGKGFFSVRSTDPNRLGLFDEAYPFLPYDRLAEGLMAWNTYCRAFPRTYAGLQGERYFKKYLHGYLHPIGKTYYDGSAWHVQEAFAQSLEKTISLEYNNRLGKVLSKYREVMLELGDGPLVQDKFLDVLQWDVSRESYLQTEDHGTSDPDEVPESAYAGESEIFVKADFPVAAENISWNRSPWFAFSNGADGWSMVSVELAPHSGASNQNPEDTGKAIALPDVPGIEFLVHDSVLSAGKKPSIGHPERTFSMQKAETRTFYLDDKRYRFRTLFLDSPEGSSKAYHHRYALLEHNGNSLVLMHNLHCEESCEDEIEENIRWAGDLDDDGKVDFILQGSDSDEGCGFTRLFLSKPGPPKKPLKLIVKQYSEDCGGC